ncbi:MAG TPA: PilT/PilU family type 4a pilus ATPase [Thermoanaerobaculia bacterium]|jgi:twitching motility protein PilT|nr:PilT/PilU family type 4a pilus ATPase [Thermoanaerobaculia bacterium]
MSDLLRDPDLDRLVEQLNQGQPNPIADPSITAPRLVPSRLSRVDEGEPLESLLAEMARRGASDLLLVTDRPPVFRVDGRLLAAERPGLDDAEIRSLFSAYSSERIRHQLETLGSADFSLRLASGGGAGFRFRVNVHRQRGGLAAAIRALPTTIPTLASLNLPAGLARLIEPTRGLVLLAGPTGSGKSSTLAALVGEIERTRPCHVITIEDPIEYEHPAGRSIIEQIELGGDTPSFAAALRAALRQDPDVILVGEMRDLETVATALTAAETGHLILSTLHSTDVVQAIHRIVDVFPSSQQNQIRHQLALSLHAVVCQQLLPRADGAGRVPAVEILMATYPVRHQIRNQSLQKLYTEITLGKAHGMISFEESLAGLVRNQVVTLDEARVRSPHPDELASLLLR